MQLILLTIKGCCDSCLDRPIYDNLWIVMLDSLYQPLSPQFLFRLKLMGSRPVAPSLFCQAGWSLALHTNLQNTSSRIFCWLFHKRFMGWSWFVVFLLTFSQEVHGLKLVCCVFVDFFTRGPWAEAGLLCLVEADTTWMLLNSKSSVTEEVIWPLKLSMITSAGVSSLKEGFADLMQGIISTPIMVPSFDQCLAECVMS